MMVNILSSYKMFQIMQKLHYDNSKELLLEPLSCILRLILLSYKPEGTKISICNNSMQYQEKSYFQSIMRSFQGDTREDLHNLYHPILKCLEWYSPDNNIHKYFYQKSIEGLETLMKTYEHKTTIIYTISHYRELLHGNQPENNIVDSEKISPLVERFKDFWNQEEIETIYKLCLLIENETDQDIYLQSLEDIITSKETKVYEYIKQSCTKYTDK